MSSRKLSSGRLLHDHRLMRMLMLFVQDVRSFIHRRTPTRRQSHPHTHAHPRERETAYPHTQLRPLKDLSHEQVNKGSLLQLGSWLLERTGNPLTQDMPSLLTYRQLNATATHGS